MIPSLTEVLNQIILGDCIEVLKEFPENSIDLIVTDPPYGLGFMGKEWDKALPPREAFVEMYRVLKPGALAFVMSSPRQDLVWRMCALLEEAGFELKQSFISWIYKTGFPKALDVSKGIDRKLGVIEKRSKQPNPLASKQTSQEAGKGLSGPRNQNLWITEPASDLAKQWVGWKAQTGLKPALEPILMVNKPFSESTTVDNVLRWGTGAINVDACRIPFQNKDDRIKSINKFIKTYRDTGKKLFNKMDNSETEGKKRQDAFLETSQKGRFPANLIVSDDALDDGEITKSGDLLPHHNLSKDENGARVTNVYGKYTRLPENFRGDEGGKSRYFDLDAWAEHHGFLDVAKPDTRERDFGLRGKKKQPKSKFNKSDGKTERFDGAVSVPRRNVHPTVKPIKLMAYLIELGCPKDGVVLDPFVGSGTTCIAAKRLRRRYIGIEVNEEYHGLAVSRVAAYPQPLEWFNKSSGRNPR